jgi:hypothetical protein
VTLRLDRLLVLHDALGFHHSSMNGRLQNALDGCLFTASSTAKESEKVNDCPLSTTDEH